MGVSNDENRFSAVIGGPAGENVDCQFEETGDGCFRVRFTPSKVGNYTIKIYKGNSKDPLSEFAHFVSDEHVGDKASFTINIEEHKKSYTATVTSPSNTFVECIVEQSEDGNCMVRFTPQELGDHTIRIYADDNLETPESEFIYNVTDLNCEVGYGPGSTKKVGHDFRPGVKTSGTRRYTVSVMSPSKKEVECEFEELEDGKCKVRFMPNEIGDYAIKIFKITNGELIYEFNFTSERSHIGEITSFTITIQEEKVRLTATVTSPTNAQVECTLEEAENDNYIVRFVPREVGNYTIKLFQDGADYPISQFTYKVIARSSKAPPAPPNSRIFYVGEIVRMTINVDGRVVLSNSKYSATVTSPSGVELSSIFEELDDGTCKIRFVPNELGTYIIKLYKFGNDVPISQFTFDVENEHMNETASFTITIQERQRKFSCKVFSPSNKEVAHTLEESEDGICIVKFTPTETGNYLIQIFENNESVPAVQIIYKIVDKKYDLSKKRKDEKIFRVGEIVRLELDVAEEKNKFTATVTSPSNALIDCYVEESEEGNCLVRFTPKEPGDYLIRIFQGTNPVPIYQFTYTVSSEVIEETLKKVYKVGETAKIDLDLESTNKRMYSATVLSPSGKHIHCRVEETEDGSVRVRFIPSEIGDYVIRLFQNDMQISQFTYKVSDEKLKKSKKNPLAYGSNCNLKDDIHGNYVYIQDQIFKVGEKVSFYADIVNKKREFSASVTSPAHQYLETEVIETSPEEFNIRFAPKELGDHVIKIYHGDSKTPVYQFIYKVRGFIGKVVEFKVTSFESEPGKLAYKIMCPPDSKINYNKKNNNDGGLYEINVRFNTSSDGVEPTVGNGAGKCTAEGPGLRQAKVGEVSTFKVNTSEAPRGSLMVGVEGPRQPAKEIIVKHIGGQVYSVDYVLDMVGNYSLYVLWSGEHIPGSPFHVTV